MASEIKAATQSGNTLYVHILNASGQRWNGSAFETYSAVNWANYCIALTEQGSSGIYVGNFPAITIPATYEYYAYIQQGVSQAEGDTVVNAGTISWNGAAVTSTSTGGMSGSDFYTYILSIFKRTDKAVEIYEAITDVITEMRRKHGFAAEETQTTISDTITVLGDYKMDVDSNFGRLIGDVMIVDGDDGEPLEKKSKDQFDALYPNPDYASVEKGKPIHYCVFGDQILLGPVPDKVTYTYKKSYSLQAPTTITASTVSVPFTRMYREVVKSGVLMRLYIGLGLDAEAQKYTSLYQAWFEQAVELEKENKSAVRFTRYSGC